MGNDIRKGIKGCYYQLPEKQSHVILLSPGEVIYLLAGRKNRFYLEDTDSILGPETKNREATIKKAKWAFMLAYYWQEAKETKKGQELPLWASLEGGSEFVNDLGIGKQYKEGSYMEITPALDDVWIGYFYRMEVFNYTPGTGLNFDFMVLDKPKIRMVYFDKQILKPVHKGFSIDDGYYCYGEVITLYVNTHLLPMEIHPFYHDKYGKIETEESFKNLIIEVYLTNDTHKKLLEEPIKSGSLQDYLANEHNTTSNKKTATAANLDFKVPLLIDFKWKDTLHTRSERVKHYSVYVVIKNTETGATYEYTPNMTNILRIAKSNRDFENEEVDSLFSVKYDSMDTILGQLEAKKNNMIQYIGDIEYNRKESNPCAYSVITVNDGEKDLELFNEYTLNDKVDDKTQGFADIVAGDKEKKTVKITAKYLKHKGATPEAVRTSKNGHLCEKILNDGEFHRGIHDVFKMEWIVGQWVPSRDPILYFQNLYEKLKIGKFLQFIHPSHASSAPKLKPYTTDQEAKGIESPYKEHYETVTVAGIQGLTEKDFSIDEADDSITLQLKYKYNKSYDSQIINYLTGEQNYLTNGILSDNIKNLWVVRYLIKWIKNEPLEQLYFVPVTTCRYPNQIAKIRVFPDMKWVINFNYNIKTPLYYKANTALTEYYSGYNEDKINTSNNTKRKEILNKSVTNELQSFVGSKSSFGLYVSCEVNGNDKPFEIGNDFAEKYRKMLQPLFWMVSKLDSDLGVSNAQAEQASLLANPSTSKGLLARFNNSSLAMSFELKPPSLGAGLGIGYATSQNGTITYELDGRIKANPILGANVTLDILALGSKFKPWGAIIDALDIASFVANLFSGGRIELEYKIEIRFYAEVKLVGKEIGVNSETGEKKYESEAKLTYNFLDKQLKFYGGLQGKILGELEISASVKIKANVKDAKGKPLDEKKQVAEASVGAKASSYVKLTCPFELNKEGNLDIDFFFSGIKLEVWFKASLNGDEENSEPSFTKDILPEINIKKEIKF
ncbi:hypothetical protein O2K51_08420 [Apibacter raozihei]|uniref:hypothetical protein n=1 Tax=Apibacter raozihei TaxID=2500547 RepID=UPI000FE422A5|nr:hypothetical protein [Apibacter raozihei]